MDGRFWWLKLLVGTWVIALVYAALDHDGQEFAHVLLFPIDVAHLAYEAAMTQTGIAILVCGAIAVGFTLVAAFLAQWIANLWRAFKDSK